MSFPSNPCKRCGREIPCGCSGKFIALAVVLAACGTHDHGHVETPGPWPVPARVHATADDPALLADWNTELQWTVNDASFALTAIGCPEAPFVLVDPAAPADHELRLVASSPGFEPGLVGGETDGPDGAIVIAGRPHPDNPVQSPLRGIISHELGHAMGLGHADPSFGPSAMTVPPGTQIFARDAAAEACLLGCGPCDAAADPYTR